MKYLILFYISLCILEFSFQEESKREIIHCNNKGIYIEILNDCKCLPGYETFPKISKVKCNYELKVRSIALFCSIFGGIVGADMIYLGYTMKGIFKSFFPIFVTFFILRIQNNKAWLSMKISYYLSLIPIFLCLLLWLVDIIQILNGNIKDANGFNLY